MFYLCTALIRNKYVQDEKDIRDLIKEKKPFVRWGDGETALLLGSNTYFQKSSFSVSVSLLKLLVRSKGNSITILFPRLNKMEGNMAFRSTQELREIIYRLRKNYLSSNCALEFRDSKVLRDSFASDIRSSSDVVLICNKKFKDEERKLKSLFGSTVNVIYVSAQNASLNLSEINELKLYKTIIISAGPIIKYQVLTESKLQGKSFIADLGHGLDRMLNE